MLPKTLTRSLLLVLVMTAAVPAEAQFRVQNGRIYDANNNPVQLRGINWFGFDTTAYVVQGLWARNWQSMILQMKGLGFNAVRMGYCPPTLAPTVPPSWAVDETLNPDLDGLNSLQILDLVVTEFNNQGMYVLIDPHHPQDCFTISELWYTPTYSEQQWIADLVFVANRYKHLPRFLGLDLKNEPHGAVTWGAGNPLTDWNKAAERASAAVLTAAPNILVFVEGIENTSLCSSTQFAHQWGNNLEPLECFPLNIPLDRLVMSPHVYGPDVFVQAYFLDPTFPNNMPAIWSQHFSRFTDQGYPVVMGEFGGKYGHGTGAHPLDVVWQDAFVGHLIAKNMRGAFYWDWNPNSAGTGGILKDDWTTVWDDKVALLKRLWGNATAMPPGPLFDFDADGRADQAVFRPSDGIWYLLRSRDGFTATQFGLASDQIVPADYDGDGKSDIGVFRDGVWYLQRSTVGFGAFAFGTTGDIPVPADYDGDGKADLAVFRQGIWYILDSATSQFRSVPFGLSTDKPVPGDYDGDGKDDVAVFRNGTWYLLRSTQGFLGLSFGLGTDRLTPADYDGDGKADLAVFRNGTWYVQRSQAGFTAAVFGLSTDLPAPADFEGDGRADIAVFRDGFWYRIDSRNGVFQAVPFGLAGDRPIPAAYVR